MCHYDVQVLESWRTKRVIEHQKLDDVLTTLESRRASASLLSSVPLGADAPPP